MIKKYLRISLLLLFPFAEIGLTILLARWLGAGPTLLLFACPAVIGMIIQYRRFQHIKTVWKTLEERQQKKKQQEQRAKIPKQEKRPAIPEEQTSCLELLIYGLSVILLLVPGLLSHLLAFYLMIPRVQMRIITRQQLRNPPPAVEGQTL